MRTEPDRLREEASAWVVRLHSDQQTEADREAFSRWIGTSDAHADAYADLATFWESFGLLRGEEAAVLRAPTERPAARSQARQQSNVGAFPGSGKALDLGRRWAAPALAASFVGALALILFVAQGRSYATPRGTLREVTLDDGSSIALDTDTKIRVRYSPAERRLILDRGQAFIRVAKNPHRPFRVFVGDDEVRAVGTAFEVRRIGRSAYVVLVEGRVLVYRGAQDRARAPASSEPAQRPGGALAMSAGEQLDLAPGAVSPPEPANFERALAWRSDRVVFDDDQLSTVLTELNRYDGPRVGLDEDELGRLRVSGVFHAGRTQDTVAALVAALPIRVERQDKDEIILGRGAGAKS